MYEGYYNADLEKKILSAVKKATNTADICSQLSGGDAVEYGDVSRTDLECLVAGVIEAAQINTLIEVYLEWFPETPAGEEFEKQQARSGKSLEGLQVEILDYIDWLKGRATTGT